MFILLFAMWLILSGKVTLEIVLVGLALCALVYAMCCSMLDYSIQKDLQLLRAVPHFIAWFAVLLWEIAKSNWAMIRIILFPSIPVHQTLVTFDTGLTTEIARAMLADSITLTPGTITVEAGRDGRFVVHCLSDSMIEGITESRIMHIIRKVEAIYAAGV